MDRNFIYCIRSEKTSISAASVVGIFIYIPSTLPDRRKANPGFMNSPFNVVIEIECIEFRVSWIGNILIENAVGKEEEMVAVRPGEELPVKGEFWGV